MASANEPTSSGCFEDRYEAELLALEDLEPRVLFAIAAPERREQPGNYSQTGGATRRPVFRLFNGHR